MLKRFLTTFVKEKKSKFSDDGEKCCRRKKSRDLLPREAMLSAVYAVVVCLCVCVCVCLCVCLSHSGTVSKRLYVGSRKQRRTIAR